MKSEPNKKKAQAPQEEQGEKAPLWIISFADMISLLMAFFVMLLTMADTQSGKLCNPGEGVFERTVFGFKSTVSGLGLPGLFGKAGEPAYFEYGKSHYNVAGDSNDVEGRVIDASEERVRRLFGQVRKGMKTYSRLQKSTRINFAVTPIVFEAGQAELDEDDKRFLKKFGANLEESGNIQTDIYIMGGATEKLPEEQQWILSVRRAKAAGDYLRSVMSERRQVPVYCWGSGENLQMVGTEAGGQRQPQILIAVLNTDSH
jgi:flagellar motor protein MotB